MQKTRMCNQTITIDRLQLLQIECQREFFMRASKQTPIKVKYTDKTN